jgi:uncharacterized protein
MLGLGRLLRTALGPRRGAPVCRTAIEIRDLPPSFDRYTVVGLSDFHHAPGGDLSWLRHAVTAANAQSPDAIVLLGDYGESFKRAPAESRRWYRESLQEMTPELSHLRARDGIFAVLGNHDYYGGATGVVEWLERMGLVVLVNRCHRLTRGRATLRIAGLDDVREGEIDGLAGCDVDEDVPTIVLSHNPDGILRLAPRLRADVVLAGHTHGGQVVLPGVGALVTMARTCGRTTASGWVPNSRAPLYVTRGLGEQRPLPMRVNCPPELLVLQLRRSDQQPA